MDTGAEIRTEPGRRSAGATDDKASEKTRDASFGVLVAVGAATLIWAALAGLCVYVVELWR